MKILQISIEVKVILNNSSAKFFKKHKKIYQTFLENIKKYYLENSKNIDIGALKTYKNIYRMRINDYRVIFKLINGEMKIIEVLRVKSRGEIYKKNKALK